MWSRQGRRGHGEVGNKGEKENSGEIVVVHLQDSFLLLHLLCDPQIGIFIDVFCSCFD